MKEIETRIIKIDVATIRNILITNNAKKVKEENQINDIYDFEDKRLLKKNGYARIRTIDDLINNSRIIYMTTKILISQDTFRVMEENEIVVSDKEAAENIFTSLDLIKVRSINRFRESYELEDGLVEIDINDKNFCPFPYIEIETNSEEKLERIVELLGYTLEDTTSKTIYQLIEENK
jgi:adenylate cyclase class 2